MAIKTKLKNKRRFFCNILFSDEIMSSCNVLGKKSLIAKTLSRVYNFCSNAAGIMFTNSFLLSMKKTNAMKVCADFMML